MTDLFFVSIALFGTVCLAVALLLLLVALWDLKWFR
jgi:hypothetical protein